MTEQEKINQWYKDYEQISQQWQEWLSANFDRYHSAEAAWIAFNKTQHPNRRSISPIKKNLC